MRKLSGFFAFTLSLGLATSLATAAVASPAKPPVDRQAIAEKLVRQCAGIQENDLVMVSGGTNEMELLEDIAVSVRRVGAFPLLTVGTDRLVRHMYDDVPATYDAQTPLLGLKLAGILSASITVDFGDDPALLAHVPPARMAARSIAGQPVSDLYYSRSIRQVNLGNGLDPTASLAMQFAIPLADLEKLFWDGVNVDYARLQATGQTVAKLLEGGQELRITNPNGTDLRMKVNARPVLVSDGVISAEDVQKGGVACQVWLPAGEVYLTPVPGTAEGRLVVDHNFYQDQELVGLTLEIAGGRVTGMTAKSGLQAFKARYDAAGTGKDAVSVLDLGINPNVTIPPGSKMTAYMPSGMVSLNLGNNIWAGGENRSDFGFTFFIPGSTLTVDGRSLVEKGRLEASLLSK